MDLLMASERLMPEASSVFNARYTSSSSRTETARATGALYPDL
jgi:hypothetical protein